MLSGTYCEVALSKRTSREWFQRFKSGYFDVEDQRGGGKDKIFEDSELDVLLAKNSWQTQEELAESLGVTQQAFSNRLKAMALEEKRPQYHEMLGHMSHERTRHTWLRKNGWSYLTRRTLQTFLLPTTICFYRWSTVWLMRISLVN